MLWYCVWTGEAAPAFRKENRHDGQTQKKERRRPPGEPGNPGQDDAHHAAVGCGLLHSAVLEAVRSADQPARRTEGRGGGPADRQHGHQRLPGDDLRQKRRDHGHLLLHGDSLAGSRWRPGLCRVPGAEDPGCGRGGCREGSALHSAGGAGPGVYRPGPQPHSGCGGGDHPGAPGEHRQPILGGQKEGRPGRGRRGPPVHQRRDRR